MIVAMVFAGFLLLLALFSIRFQIRTLKRLRDESHMASDERSYLRNQAYRRMLTSVLILGLAGMLSGAYLSGLEQRAEEIGQKKPANEEGEKPPVRQEDKDFLPVYMFYWGTTLFLIFLVVSLAIVDIVATRRYAWQQLKRIQSENRSILERDLAFYRQQKANDRMRGPR
jgi:hypothetical protein